MKIIDEFKEFAVKGNMLDMAVGIIIGGAFGKIVTSLVNDILMPIIGIIMGGINLKDMAWTLKSGTESLPPVVLAYGKFIQTMVDFLIIAWAMFLVVKLANKIRRAQEEIALKLKKTVSEKIKPLTGKDE